MRIYTVHTLAWSAAADGDAIFVKEGFSWPALFFGSLWALWHGMWLTALVVFILGAVVGAAGEYAGLVPEANAVLQFVIQFSLGLWGNDLRRRKLRLRGYTERAVAAGRRVAEAERRYFAAA